MYLIVYTLPRGWRWRRFHYHSVSIAVHDSYNAHRLRAHAFDVAFHNDAWLLSNATLWLRRVSRPKAARDIWEQSITTDRVIYSQWGWCFICKYCSLGHRPLLINWFLRLPRHGYIKTPIIKIIRNVECICMAYRTPLLLQWILIDTTFL